MLGCEDLLLKFSNAPEGSRVIFLTASGTAGMQAVVDNLLSQDDKSYVINGGGFGDRFVQILHKSDLSFTQRRVDKNDNLKDIKNETINNHTTLIYNAHETTIGLKYNLKSLGIFAKNSGLFNIVDAISLFLTDKIDMQKDNIDTMIISSQKALALPPGLCMVILTPKAIKRLNDVQNIYFDFKEYLKDGVRGQTPYTPAVTIILQLQKRLQKIDKIGLTKEISKKRKLANYFRKKIEHLPIKPYTKYMPNAMSTFEVKDANDVVNDIEKMYNIVLCPNAGELKDKVFRVSHMGAINKKDIDYLVESLDNYFSKKVIR
jgi:aspartate aminotransferase-like enzyme